MPSKNEAWPLLEKILTGVMHLNNSEQLKIRQISSNYKLKLGKTAKKVVLTFVLNVENDKKAIHFENDVNAKSVEKGGPVQK